MLAVVVPRSWYGLHNVGKWSKENMSDQSTGTKDMTPHFEDIQAHYDLSDDFFGVFQDPTRKYSCAFFTGPDVTLSEAQIANVDQHLDRLDLKPGMTLLEVGCGWGLTLQRAMEKYDVNVIGLTLSENQQAYCNQLLGKLDSERTFDVRLEGWEQFHSPVDRIVSIEAFEHFGFDRYDDFFKTCFDILPDDGRMTIQSSVGYHPYDLADARQEADLRAGAVHQVHDHRDLPRGAHPDHPDDGRARREGRLRRAGDAVAAQPLHQDPRHLGRPPGGHKDEAIAATDEENYNRYMKYLTGCQYYFIDESIDVSLVTYLKPGATA